MAGPELPDSVAYWLDEEDWFCFVEFLPRNDVIRRAEGAEFLGYVAAFATMTETRMLALALNDIPREDRYLFLLSFSSEENRQLFQELMWSNEITDVDDEFSETPSRDEIRNARPWGTVLPRIVFRHATMVAIMLVGGRGSEIFI